MTYAAKTEVSVEKTRMELDTLLQKNGASQRMMGTDDELGVAFVAFTIARRQVRLRVPLPKLDEVRASSARPPGFWKRPEDRKEAWFREQLEQRQRSRWRALLLLVKAKLEAVELGVSTIEREFLADISLPDGRSVHQALAQDIESAYLTGTMPPLLGSGS